MINVFKRESRLTQRELLIFGYLAPLPTELPFGQESLQPPEGSEDESEEESDSSDSGSDSSSSSGSDSEDVDDELYMPPLPEGPAPSKEDQARFLALTKPRPVINLRIPQHGQMMSPPGAPNGHGPPGGHTMNPYGKMPSAIICECAVPMQVLNVILNSFFSTKIRSATQFYAFTLWKRIPSRTTWPATHGLYSTTSNAGRIWWTVSRIPWTTRVPGITRISRTTSSPWIQRTSRLRRTTRPSPRPT